MALSLYQQSSPISSELILTFTAERARMERTGVHAKVSIALNGVKLDSDNFNIERSGDRTTLAYAAHRAMGTRAEGYSKEQLRHELGIFCEAVWPAQMARYAAKPLYGDPMGEPLLFLAKPHVVRGGGTILFAPPESYKSWTALIISVVVDAGLNGLWETIPTPTLYVNLERSEESLRRRLGQVSHALGFDYDRPLEVINARGQSLRSIYDSIEKAVLEKEIGLVVLDSISRFGYGDLTDNRDVNRSMDDLNSLVPTWLALAHTPRADDTHIYGGVHFEAAADVTVQLNHETIGNTAGIQMIVRKSNDSPKPPPKVLKYGFDAEGLLTIEPGNAQEFKDLLSKKIKSLPVFMQMVEFMKREGAMELIHLAEMTGASIGTIRKEASLRRELFVRLDKGVYGLREKGTEILPPDR